MGDHGLLVAGAGDNTQFLCANGGAEEGSKVAAGVDWRGDWGTLTIGQLLAPCETSQKRKGQQPKVAASCQAQTPLFQQESVGECRELPRF